MRSFEKISFKQFKKDICDDKELYDSYKLPVRHTKYSAGYDFELIKPVTIRPNEVLKVPTGLKVRMYDDEALLIIVRSGIGFKYNVRLTNQVGLIESDYYNNEENEGHMWISIQNHSDKELNFEKGDRIVQGMFTKFLTVENENIISEVRKGGLGSTTKKKEGK